MKVYSYVAAAFAVAFLSTAALAVEPATPSGGVLIKTVIPNSPAAQVGLKSGDRIMSIAGTPTEDAFDMAWAISSHAPGARLQLQVIRNGQPVTLAGTLGRAVRTTPVSAGPTLNLRAVPTPKYIYTPGEINDQRAFGG